MKKLIVYYSFVLTTAMVVVGVGGAKTWSELVGAVMFYPLAVYFFMLIWPRRSKAIELPRLVVVEGEKRPVVEGEIVEEETSRGFDVDRRTFLKLIGSAGLSVFFFSIFTKKAEAAFFGSVPGPGTVKLKDAAGNQIDPAEKQPLDGYQISEIEDGLTSYYGFVNKDGGWFIQREDSSGAYRYVKGSSGFAANWADKENLSYDYFDSVF